ncbi:DUF927 domain-containing protein [[Clostridium] colinum]|uniref:DUF927 domain-containing protein n=1 Tax=[Clostridium] colinum TaxID=36835 RepID=UPI00202568B9|nr:DUF927 domain-containing protein [[Clostridium] colinum]
MKNDLLQLTGDDYIELINKDDDLPNELFFTIIEEQNEVFKIQLLEKARRKSKSMGRLREFNNLLNAWTTKYSQEKKQALSNKTNFTGQALSLYCGKYKTNDMGIEYEYTSNNNSYCVTVCPHPLLPVERLVNIDTNNEKINLAFFKDERWQNVVADCVTVYNKSNICSLADRGILVTSENARDIVKYITEVISQNMKEIPLYKSISRLGWIEGNQFAPYVEDIKYDGDDAFENIYKHVKESGDYEKWLKHIKILRKNIYIRLLMATSFASPLIEKVGALPFVLHLWGTTGFGKTVTLMVGMSIWGNPAMGCLTRTMNMTQNSMARTSAFLYNIPFAADELQQIKTKWDNYDNLVMYLCEGIDRGRAKARGGVEETKVWKNSFIFTGEEPVTKADSGGGVKNRVIEIEVDKQIIEDGNLTANIVKDNYGFAGKKFIEYIQTLNIEDLKNEYRNIFKDILEKVDTTEKQAMSMALIILGDKLACECIFKDEQPLKLNDVRKYLTSNKSVDIGRRSYDFVLNWIAENQVRFTPEDNNGALWGKIEKDFVMVNKKVLEENLLKNNYDYTAVTKAWDKYGLVEKNSQGKFVHQRKVFDIKASYIKILLKENEIEDIAQVEIVNEDDKLPF